LYSWGMGFNYVLGSREEDNLFVPTVVHPKQFHENQVKLVGTGAQHVVVLTTDSPDNKDLPPFEMVPIKDDEKLVVEEEKKEDTNQPEEEVKEEVVPHKAPVEAEKVTDQSQADKP